MIAFIAGAFTVFCLVAVAVCWSATVISDRSERA
jgi:hypothetical protein